jgi:hypothetical protein
MEPTVPTPRTSESLPANSVLQNALPSLLSNDKSPKRHPPVPPAANASRLSFTSGIDKKERRGSVLGRLAKKFSVMRKLDHRGAGGGHDRQQSEASMIRQPSPEKESGKISEVSKRVPPPPVQGDPPTDDVNTRDRPSSVELEPFSMGKLTIANPDIPSSPDSTPMVRHSRLPREPSPKQDQNEKQPSVTVSAATAPDVSQSPMQPLSAAQATPSSASTRPTVVEAPMQSAKTPTPKPSAEDMVARISSSNAPTPSATISAPAADHSGTTAPTSTSYFLSAHMNQPSLPMAADPAIVSLLSLTSTDDSPLSGSSMIANPPTPYSSCSLAPGSTPTSSPPMSTLANPPTPRYSPAPTPSADSNGLALTHAPGPSQAKRDVSKKVDEPGRLSTSAIGRQTETFRLVRNPSGNASPAGQAIVAAGVQWEVVEATENPRRNKTKEREKSSKMNDRDSLRRDQRRQDKHKGDIDTEHTNGNGQSRQRSTTGQAPDRTGSGSKPLDISGISETMNSHSHHESSNSSRRCSGDCERGEDRKAHEIGSSTSPPNLNKAQPPTPPPSPGPSNIQRRQSRPTSEVPSSAELNALRAREAWEMDRLHKGKSMHFGVEPSSSAPVKVSMGPSNDAHGTLARDNSARSASHGSSHTSFLVAPPFQSQPLYPEAVPPPPIIYSSSQQTSLFNPSPHSLQHSSEPPHIRHFHSSSMPSSFSSADITHTNSRRPLANPLPPPPRESPYSPSPLPPVLSDMNTGLVAEYWTKYAGMTATR